MRQKFDKILGSKSFSLTFSLGRRWLRLRLHAAYSGPPRVVSGSPRPRFRHRHFRFRLRSSLLRPPDEHLHQELLDDADLSWKQCKGIDANPIIMQWVETNQSNFRIYSTDIRLSLPHGTMLMAIQMLNTDVCRC